MDDMKLEIRSNRSNIKVFLIFENITNRDVAVFWVDYNSLLVHYRTLRPLEKMMVTTYKTHPWIFFDANSGERMHINHEDIYWPIPVYIR